MKHLSLPILLFPLLAQSYGCNFLPEKIALDNGVVLKRQLLDKYEVVSTPVTESPAVSQQIARNNSLAIKQAGADTSDPNSTISVALRGLKDIQENLEAIRKEILESQANPIYDPFMAIYSSMVAPDLKRRHALLTQMERSQYALIDKIFENAKKLGYVANLPLYAKLKMGNVPFDDDKFRLDFKDGRSYIFTKIYLNMYQCQVE